MSNPFEEEAAAEEEALRNSQEEKAADTEDKQSETLAVTKVSKNPFENEVGEYEEPEIPNGTGETAKVVGDGYDKKIEGLDKVKHSEDELTEVSVKLLSSKPTLELEGEDSTTENRAEFSYKIRRKHFERSDWRKYLASVYSILKLIQVVCCGSGIICAAVADVQTSWWTFHSAKFVEVVFGVGIGLSTLLFSINLADTLSRYENSAFGNLRLLNDSVWSLFDLAILISWSLTTLAGSLVCAFASFDAQVRSQANETSEISTMSTPASVDSSHNALLPATVFSSLAFSAYLVDATLASIRACAIVRLAHFENALGVNVIQRLHADDDFDTEAAVEKY